MLSLITFLPAVAALVLALFLRVNDAAAGRNAKWVALVATLATLAISLYVLAKFDPSNTGMQFVAERTWILGLNYKMGVDGISILFVMLTTFLMPITILSCWNVETRVKEYMIAFLLLETLMLGVFCALDLVLFYLFFEPADFFPVESPPSVCHHQQISSRSDRIVIRRKIIIGLMNISF